MRPRSRPSAAARGRALEGHRLRPLARLGRSRRELAREPPARRPRAPRHARAAMRAPPVHVPAVPWRGRRAAARRDRRGPRLEHGVRGPPLPPRWAERAPPPGTARGRSCAAAARRDRPRAQPARGGRAGASPLASSRRKPWRDRRRAAESRRRAARRGSCGPLKAPRRWHDRARPSDRRPRRTRPRRPAGARADYRRKRGSPHPATTVRAGSRERRSARGMPAHRVEAPRGTPRRRARPRRTRHHGRKRPPPGTR